MKKYWDARYKRQGRRTVGCCSVPAEEFWALTSKARRILGNIRCLIRDQDVLDFGCGWGRLSRVLIELGANSVHGLDLSKWAVENARDHVPDGTFGLFDGKAILYPDERFDAILCWTVLQHIPLPEIEGVAEELFRVLRSGGSLILYENVAAQKHASHIWFRPAGFYEDLFKSTVLISKAKIDWVDPTREEHCLMILEKP